MKIPLVRFAAFFLPLLACAQAPLPPPLPSGPLEVPPLNPALPTIFIAGDSTAARDKGQPIQGWGVPFADYFDPAKVNVANHARAGRSTRTYIREGLWEKLLADVKAGDVVLIQFGHNDGDAVNEQPPGSTKPLRARGTLPGLGPEKVDIINAVTHEPETVFTFGHYIRRMAADVKAKGATPILLSLTVRNEWPGGRVERGSGNFRTWDRQLARELGLGFVDLTRAVADAYQAMGPDKVKALFGTDHTHTNVAGADFNAAQVVAGLKGLRPAPLAKDVFSAKGAAVEADSIGWLGLPEPADPQRPSLFLIGDSTVRNDNGEGKGGQWGWGDFLAAHFDPAKLNLVNRAIGGLTGRSFLNQGHWERALMLMKPGDFLVIQFGTNDAASLDNDKRARASLPGTGEETQEVEKGAGGQPETVHANGWYLRKFVREARAAGVTPVLCSMVPRKIWADGKIGRSTTSALWAQQVAAQEGVAFVDLNNLVAARYEELGPEKTNALFADEHTHTSREGAIESALIVSRALRALPGDPLGKFGR